MANISASTIQSDFDPEKFAIFKMRTSSDIVYYFRYQALVFYVCKYVKYLYYEQKSRPTNVRTFLIRQNLKSLLSVFTCSSSQCWDF